jgi:hypothetical protein
MTGSVADRGWGLLRFGLEDARDIRRSHPLVRVPIPAPLNHVPHSIRNPRPSGT